MGLILGFIIEVGAIVLAGVLAFTDRELAGGVIGAAGLLTLGGTTVIGMSRRGKERQRRFNQLTTPLPSRKQP
jgi:hypothetical protein